jgi:hypothetical protein
MDMKILNVYEITKTVGGHDIQGLRCVIDSHLGIYYQGQVRSIGMDEWKLRTWWMSGNDALGPRTSVDYDLPKMY